MEEKIPPLAPHTSQTWDEYKRVHGLPDAPRSGEATPPHPKQRSLLQTDPDQWDTEERGCAMPIALLLLGGLIFYACWCIVAYSQ
jgi:hypothetical protein